MTSFNIGYLFMG